MKLLEQAKYWAVQLGGAMLMAVWEIRNRVRGAWRRSALRERLQEWRARL
ncbi:hypothetical protein [Ottowia sp. VDI28]